MELVFWKVLKYKADVRTSSVCFIDATYRRLRIKVKKHTQTTEIYSASMICGN